MDQIEKNKETILAVRKDAYRKASKVQELFRQPLGQDVLEILREEFSVSGKLTGKDAHSTTVRAAHMEIFLHIDAIMRKDLSDE